METTSFNRIVLQHKDVRQEYQHAIMMLVVQPLLNNVLVMQNVVLVPVKEVIELLVLVESVIAGRVTFVSPHSI
jgi:hypothetical protein